ncbi:NHLP leader peptide family RiPP precursor [Aurantimonas sp. VKM B-3413]|uniref:NHLP leader peptide family RiPP precursor n=1 Tax=Aurantimonas sp. VKM B-3413 TaxID=2779401 RepID=UPI001E5C8723|nr:NHLP leader peptide family RiPP precursor [Aurantimonas sp. VKM B-3413]MCB8836127.1 NHLP leader peptide family RiPP precursor [Aurantimonas sp. VKM B-3413]
MPTRRELEENLASRAARDATFRAELVQDPRAVLERELGITVPEGKNVRIVEESATDYVIVIPPAEGGTDNLESSTGMIRLLGDGASVMY